MINYLLTATVFLLLAGSSLGQSITAWTKFTTPDKSCSILLPNTPEKESNTIEKESGKIYTDVWVSKTTADGYLGIYILSTALYPIDLSPKAELEGDRDNFLKAVNAKLVDESDITLNGIPGKEFTGVSDKYTFKSRVYYVNRRAYQFAAAEPTEHFDVGRVKKFLDSFTFAR